MPEPLNNQPCILVSGFSQFHAYSKTEEWGLRASVTPYPSIKVEVGLVYWGTNYNQLICCLYHEKEVKEPTHCPNNSIFPIKPICFFDDLIVNVEQLLSILKIKIYNTEKYNLLFELIA